MLASSARARWRARPSLFAASIALVACGRIDLGSQLRGGDGLGGSGPDASAPPLTLPPSAIELTYPTQLLPPTVVFPPVDAVPPPDDSQSSTEARPLGEPQPTSADAGRETPPEVSGDPSGSSPERDASTGTSTDPPEPGPPSCRHTLERCGPDKDSCCLSLSVQGGTFALPVGTSGESVSATVSSFYLDKYEVTVGHFREFLTNYDEWHGQNADPLADAGAAHPRVPASGWDPSLELPASAADFEQIVRECKSVPQSTLDLPNSSERIPLNCVTWSEAAAFCSWDGARLPTYAEWSYAAFAGAQQRIYPWGNEPTPSRAYALYGCVLGLERPECTAAYVLPVGSYPDGAGFFGHADLAGSMSEWVLDGPLSASLDNSCVDCVPAPSDVRRFWKGGSWQDPPTFLENAYLAGGVSTLRLQFVGLRCARDRAP